MKENVKDCSANTCPQMNSHIYVNVSISANKDHRLLVWNSGAPKKRQTINAGRNLLVRGCH
ncbi:hypothetical protein PISMIDRAFT_357489 [Pisolithus microcarpus 441]|uniref:Uncharacterized protein n=1 Tax=Pisolithus microcarpus 441 TaxID=765257 RepID=A0A0C9YKF5_9AGAM|nr:hypothetical protein PISMIDRAFT_357489 [Pisolithus microcarpus 441]